MGRSFVCVTRAFVGGIPKAFFELIERNTVEGFQEFFHSFWNCKTQNSPRRVVIHPLLCFCQRDIISEEGNSAVALILLFRWAKSKKSWNGVPLFQVVEQQFIAVGIFAGDFDHPESSKGTPLMVSQYRSTQTQQALRERSPHAQFLEIIVEQRPKMGLESMDQNSDVCPSK